MTAPELLMTGHRNQGSRPSSRETSRTVNYLQRVVFETTPSAAIAVLIDPSVPVKSKAAKNDVGDFHILTSFLCIRDDPSMISRTSVSADRLVTAGKMLNRCIQYPAVTVLAACSAVYENVGEISPSRMKERR